MTLPAGLTLQVASLTAVAALAFLLVGTCNEVRSLKTAQEAAEAALKRANEASKLTLAGVQQARAVEAKELEATLDGYRRRGDYLSDALDVALKQAPKAVTILSASGSTGPLHVDGGAVSPPSSAPVPAAGTVAPSPPTVPASVCLLHPGDSGEIRFTGAALKTEAGNVMLVAGAEAWRLAPDARLFGGELHLDASYLKPPDPVRGPGWGGGLAVAVGRWGWALGPAIASPPLTWWRFQLEPSAALTLGPGGDFVATGQAIVRFQ